MAKYTGGMQVSGGYYWNPRAWEVAVIPNEGGRLEGADGAHFVKVPFPLLLVVVPVLGALFLMFLPFIGFAMIAHALVKKVTGGAKEAATDLAATMTAGLAPGEAHLTGKTGEEKPAEGKPTAEIEKLQNEIDARRTDVKK
jgi:apolipoprotein N-acyltransferase